VNEAFRKELRGLVITLDELRERAPTERVETELNSAENTLLDVLQEPRKTEK